jgi:hypothetical protein
MKKNYSLFLLSLLLQLPLYAQPNICRMWSIETFGGNGWTRLAARGWYQQNADGSITLPISSTSDSGNIITNCPSQWVTRTYDASMTTVLNQSCVRRPEANGYRHNFFFFYPQSNGDTIEIVNTEQNSNDLCVRRTAADGTLLWSKHYGGSGADYLMDVLPMPDSSFVVGMYTFSSNGDVGSHYGSWDIPDLWLLKLDYNGDIVWKTLLGGSNADLFAKFQPAADGGVYLFGSTFSNDGDFDQLHKGDSDLFVAKLDSMGQKQWIKTLGGSHMDGVTMGRVGFGAVPDGAGGFYIASATQSTDGDVHHRSSNDTDLWVLHIDSMAHIIWERTYGGVGYQYATHMCKATDGTLWIGAEFDSGTQAGEVVNVVYGYFDSWVLHIDTLGNIINQRVFGNSADNRLDAVIALPDNKVAAIGTYEGGPFLEGPYSEGLSNQTLVAGGESDMFIAILGPETMAVPEVNNSPKIAWDLYPNPAQQELHIKVPQSNTAYTVKITDVKGKTLLNRKMTGTALQLNTSTWAAGTYQASLYSDGKIINTKTFTVVR